jgi:hypothetical protein
VTYESPWERLSDALARLEAAGLPTEEAQSDICRAMADRAINFRGRLKKQANGPMRSNDILEGSEFELAATIKPEDLDWERSRPIKPLPVRRPHPYHGFWELEWIELFVPDIIERFGGAQQRGKASRSIKPAAAKGQPTFDRAKRAITELWPDGPPEQAVLPNKKLVGLVEEKLKELGLPRGSPDTILRAAGRRRK